MLLKSKDFRDFNEQTPKFKIVVIPASKLDVVYKT